MSYSTDSRGTVEIPDRLLRLLAVAEPMIDSRTPQIMHGTFPMLGQPQRISVAARILLAILAGGTIGLLVLATVLIPSPTGLGTHTQLGLPPCASYVMFGSRCPACGMTTSWSLVVRLQMKEAMQANLGGFLLAIIAMASLPLNCYFSFSGRVYQKDWIFMVFAVAIAVALFAATLQWVAQLTQ